MPSLPVGRQVFLRDKNNFRTQKCTEAFHMKEYCVYILRCGDDSYYTGVTNNLERRFAEHQEGIDPASYTYDKRPVTLVHIERYTEVMDAINREKQIQNWSRKKKEALMTFNEEQLQEFSKKNFHQ